MSGRDDTMIWRMPRRIILSSGAGEGATALNAFDKALVDAGVGNLNLIRVTSVVPAGATVLRLKDTGPALNIKPGTLVPAVYTSLTSDVAQARISAAIIAGRPDDQEKNGMIFEKSALGKLGAIQNITRNMLEESFRARNLTVATIALEGSEYVVKERVGCVVAIALMLI